MTRTEVIAIAREADPFGDDGRLVSLAMLTPGTLERFAALVAAREREACAALILMLVERLERADKISGHANNKAAITAGRARLKGKP